MRFVCGEGTLRKSVLSMWWFRTGHVFPQQPKSWSLYCVQQGRYQTYRAAQVDRPRVFNTTVILLPELRWKEGRKASCPHTQESGFVVVTQQLQFCLWREAKFFNASSSFCRMGVGEKEQLSQTRRKNNLEEESTKVISHCVSAAIRWWF